VDSGTGDCIMLTTTIVIVEDEEELRENLKDLLEFKGYTVIPFPTGEALLEHFDDVHADLILLDIQLPGMDGIEVLKHVKALRPETPVAMVSASSVRGVLTHALENGAARTILKPYDPLEMLATVEELTTVKG
jgi:DNA-binding response OmpR family regulator